MRDFELYYFYRKYNFINKRPHITINSYLNEQRLSDYAPRPTLTDVKRRADLL